MSLVLRPFQRTFLREALKPNITIAALSMPRGNGKTTLAGFIASMVMDPFNAMFRPGTESVMVAASIEQARYTFRAARGFLGEDGYRYLDSNTRIGILHVATKTRIRIIGSNGKTSQGLVNCPWAICDEPGAWEINSGGMVWDSLLTARGKPDSPLKILVVGTLGPLGFGPGHWWFDLVDRGSTNSVYVMALRGDPAKWDKWSEIRRVNPLTAISADFRRELMEARDEARTDPRKKAAWLTFRMNHPTRDEDSQMLSVDDWERCLARPVAAKEGRPIVGVDLGGGRSFSAATAIWPSGRTEALAVAPGLPSISAQEKRDRVPQSTYQRLVDSGRLLVADGLRVQPPSQLMDAILDAWGKPTRVICDRFRLPELEDCASGIRIEPRVTRWSESSEDIRSLRKLAKDGPLSVDRASRMLLTASLAVASVKSDDAGSIRPVKQASNNCSRDDIAIALMLAAGEWERRNRKPKASTSSGIIR